MKRHGRIIRSSLKTYEQEKKNSEVLAKAHKIDIKIPVEPKVL